MDQLEELEKLEIAWVNKTKQIQEAYAAINTIDTRLNSFSFKLRKTFGLDTTDIATDKSVAIMQLPVKILSENDLKYKKQKILDLIEEYKNEEKSLKAKITLLKNS